MQVKVREQGEIAIVGPAGSIAGRAAVDFERAVVALLDKGIRLVALDFSEAELITSAGIRVIMLLAKRTRSSGGGTVLFALSDHVRSVLDVAGLMSLFQIADDERAALLRLSRLDRGAAARTTSRLTRLLLRLVGPAEPIPEGGGTKDQASALTRAVAASCAPEAGPASDRAS